MMIRRDHLFTFEALAHVVVVVIAVASLALALQRSHTTVPVLSPEPKNIVQIVPAIGVQGFKVAEFCSDPLTRVSRNQFAPIDSPFVESYTLDRTKSGVHEVAIANVYADPTRQPAGVYQENQDAFVSKEALDCIRGKAR